MKMLVRGQARPALEQEVFFWLEQYSDGVIVRAQLGDGWPWNVIKFNDDGTVDRISSVGRELGIRVDSNGTVIIN